MLKTKPYRNAKHLAWIRTKPCCHCGTNLDVIAHHLISCGLGGAMGSKQSDALTLPMCVRCHAIVHSAGGTKVINQLWYFYQLIRMAFRNNEMVGDTDNLGFCIADDDTDYLIGFAKNIRDRFSSGKMMLR